MSRAAPGALTVSFSDRERVTLYATDDLATRLEDLQDLVGEGPGHTAARSSVAGQAEGLPSSQRRGTWWLATNRP